MDQIEEVRSKIDIVQFISEYLPLKKSGRNFKANCPFHLEKTPSFIVSPERQIWKCFGCNRGGSVFNFIMEVERMDFGEALRTLAKRVGVELSSYKPSINEEARERAYKINHLASEFYHYLLCYHPAGKKGLDYILNRGITKESLQLFKLGYAPISGQGLLKYLAEKKGYKIEDLQSVGLITKHSYGNQDFFRNRIIFPLREHRGNYVGFAGRVIGKGEGDMPKYMNTFETLVYQKGSLLYGLEVTKEVIKKENKAVIVEGELDLISSFQVGVKNTVAIKGSALTELQIKLLKRFCDGIVLALDMDIAGDQATKRGIELADSFGLNVRVARIPEGKDPDEIAQKSPEVLKKAIEEAVPVYDFFIESAFNRFDATIPEGKRKIGEEILPVLAKISDEIIKSHYVRILARKLGVDETAIITQMAKVKVEEIGKSMVFNSAVVKGVSPRREILEKYFLSLAFQGHEEEKVFSLLDKGLIHLPALVRIIETLGKTVKDEKIKVGSEHFASKLPQELVEIFNHFYLFDFGSQIEDKVWREKEMEKTIRNLELLDLSEKMKEISLKMAECEKEDKGEEMEKLKIRFRIISQKLAKLNKAKNEP